MVDGISGLGTISKLLPKSIALNTHIAMIALARELLPSATLQKLQLVKSTLIKPFPTSLSVMQVSTFSLLLHSNQFQLLSMLANLYSNNTLEV